MRALSTIVLWLCAAIMLWACASESSGSGGDPSDVSANVPAAPTATQQQSVAGQAPAAGSAAPRESAAPMPAAQPPGQPIDGDPAPPAAQPPMSGMAGSAAPPPDPAVEPGPPAGPPGPPGPEDGDPSGAVVSTPDVACGGPTGFLGGANFEIGGREMIVTYPCNKRAGAPMLFFLNLHGTTPPDLHFYQHSYFSAHQFAESHNLIVVTPSAVAEQWGRSDGGADEPHLMEIIDWVYATFDGPEAFDIRAMWVGGHSWGAMYTTTFACKPELADKVKGAVIMSGIGINPTCANVISVISSAAEDDIGPVVDQGSVPMSHGCGAAQMNMVGNNEETHWPDCDPGFVHANYFMLGKSHSSSIDREVVERVVDLMNEARP